jgi:hypothetical protein
MQQKHPYRFPLFIIMVVLVSSACSKQGPTGATGPQGPTGPAGPTGPKGDIGTANVLYSDWFTPPSYTKDTVFGIWGFNYDKAAAGITQTILDSGTVLTFGKLDGYAPVIWPTNQASLLPINITFMLRTTTYTDTWSALVTTGNLRIRFVNNQNLYGSIPGMFQFRYIIIPGEVKTNSVPKDYKSLCQQYNIPEN